MDPTAWLYQNGVWKQVENPYVPANKAYWDTREKDSKTALGPSATIEAIGFTRFDTLGTRVALFEWSKEEPPDPARYLVILSLGIVWHMIYVDELPGLIHVLNQLAPIDRAWPQTEEPPWWERM